MDRSNTIKDPRHGTPVQELRRTPSSVSTACNHELFLGKTRCLPTTQRDKLITELGSFDQMARVVGGIPSWHVMAHAARSLAPALAQLQRTAHLLACSQRKFYKMADAADALEAKRRLRN
jgi:hypothetical protein